MIISLKLWVTIVAFLLAINGRIVYSQIMGGPPKASPRKADVPLIRCQVCEHFAKNAYNQAAFFKANPMPGKKYDELAVIEMIENSAVSYNDEGDWMTGLHLERSGNDLKVIDKGEPGECGEACKTIEKAVDDLIGEHDTDIAETLFMGRKNEKEFTNWLCKELTTACTRKPPSLPKSHVPYPAFTPRKGGQNMEKIMKGMEAQGMRGNMFSRDDLMNQYGDMAGDPYAEQPEFEVDLPPGMNIDDLDTHDRPERKQRRGPAVNLGSLDDIGDFRKKDGGEETKEEL